MISPSKNTPASHFSSYLIFPAFGGYGCVEWDHKDHERKPSKDGDTHGEVEEEEGEHYLEWCGPDEVEIGHEVHEPLRVHRHEVDYLSDRLLAT